MQSSKQIDTKLRATARLESGSYGDFACTRLSKASKHSAIALSYSQSFIHPIIEKTMKKLILIIALVFPFVMQAQTFEIGAIVSGSNYLGDLTNNTVLFDVGATRPSVGAFARLNTGAFLSTRASVNFIQIFGDDARSIEPSRRSRNLNFRNNIMEASLIQEINIFGFNPAAGKAFSPYVFAGVAYYTHNPTTEYNGRTVDLQPLGTEGQGIEGFDDPYALNGIAIPFGAGLKYGISDNFTLAVEFSPRKTNTDYLDDVSTSYLDYNFLLEQNGQAAADLNYRGYEYYGVTPGELGIPNAPRGNPNRNDWYYTTSITASWRFGGNGRRGAIGCPTF